MEDSTLFVVREAVGHIEGVCVGDDEEVLVVREVFGQNIANDVHETVCRSPGSRLPQPWYHEAIVHEAKGQIVLR